MFFDLFNVGSGVDSPVVKSADNAIAMFFKRYLMQRAISVFKWDGIPDHWDVDYFLYSLYVCGFVAVVRTDSFGVIPQHCTLMGQNVFYRPRQVVISNPLLRGLINPVIGVDCALIKLQPDYKGVWDLVSYHASMMALCAQTAAVNLINSKLSYVFTADGKAVGESFKEMYKRIANGDTAIVVDKALFNADGTPKWQAFEQNVGGNYIAGTVLDDMRKWEDRFNTAIGIPNANTEKRERLISDEVNANNVETVALCELWLEELKRGIDVANKLFGLQISVEKRYKGGEHGAGDFVGVVDD